MASRSLRRRGSNSSSEGSSQSANSSGSGGSSSSAKSTSSRETHLNYEPRIMKIRETTHDEKQEHRGMSLFVRRYDDVPEFVNSITELSAYTMNTGEMIPARSNPAYFWAAYNTIAYFVLGGNIKLEGGKDCFKKLKSPKAGVGTVKAGTGLYIQPKSDIRTYGTITDGAGGRPPQKVHISSQQRDENGRTTNAIVLKEDHKYHVAGDVSPPSDGPLKKERLICHRGRLREAGFEIPGPIHKDEMWLIDRSGNFTGTQPINVNMWPCSGCYESLCRREWPTPEMCAKGNNSCNGTTRYIPRAKKSGVKPAMPVFECERLLVSTYYRPGWVPQTDGHMRTIKKVLDASIIIRDWDHLAEATNLPVSWLVVIICAVPSLGERLDKRGASFVPWAGDTGLYLGTHARVEKLFVMRHLYEESDDGVIEIFTGEKVRFEEDHNGIIHVERRREGYSDRVPEGADGYLCLG